jgi:hypothetical protein
MKIGRVWVWVIAFCVFGGLAEAYSPPKAALRLDQVVTSQSRGVYGFRTTKYNKPDWGHRWQQTMGRPPVVVSPGVRGY